MLQQHDENLITILSDLIKINNDRIAGYQDAMGTTNDPDVKALFQRMIDDSTGYVRELNLEMKTLGTVDEKDSAFGGKLYRTWLAIRTTFVCTDKPALFSACEYGEDAVRHIYADVLHANIKMPYHVHEIIAHQQACLKESHDIIKNYHSLVNS
ncbi:PA2169 family four-helix-bundle protein [Chitinophaga sp. 30R24]|uniref:PA2169 family four-helix-bundle protein n=1 Tax=Chitinophaga sp. 30R24 TaxID=3248838 RepID=UPI003B9171FE